MAKSKSIHHLECEARYKTLVFPKTKDKLIRFLKKVDAEVRRIVQWDIASVRKNENNEVRFELDIAQLPDSIRNALKDVFPDYSPHSKLRIRCSEMEDGEKVWSLEGKNDIPYYKERIKEHKDGKDPAGDRALSTLKEKKSASDIVDEYTFELTESSVPAVFGMSFDDFIEAVSGQGIIAGVTEKIRCQIEETGFFQAAMHRISAECHDACIDICLQPMHDRQYLVRLELEFDTIAELDVFLDSMHRFLKKINKVFKPLNIQFAIPKKAGQGQRSLAFEQYVAMPKKNPLKTPKNFHRT